MRGVSNALNISVTMFTAIHRNYFGLNDPSAFSKFC